jgi:2-octaprenyl-6-methoxyphenol hydroxylase
MKLCILGGGLTGLSLAKSLIKKGLSVDIFLNKKNLDFNKNRTIGISNDNLIYFNKEILDIKKLLWDIKKIEIYSDNLRNEKILNFENNNKTLFAIIKNYQLQSKLFTSLKKEKLCKLKNNINYKLTNFKKYKLIINCENNNYFSKKFFARSLKKKYDSFAYTTILKHKKIKNDSASQIFTKNGPLAFLPLSELETSVVYSIKGKKNINLKELIKKYNIKYSITNFGTSNFFELKSLNLRTYYHKNILAFGDLLHRLHPLAGQGFNMTIRDIQDLNNLIDLKLKNGLELDSSICEDFQNTTRHKNYLFSSGIDFIYEFFNLETKMNNNIISKSVRLIGKNKFLNRSFKNIANSGFKI